MTIRIVILGEGVASWLTAAILARACGADALCLIEEGYDDHSLGPFGSGLPARPEWALLAARQGWGEAALVRAASGSYALGAAFSGWRTLEGSWFLPHGDSGAPIGSVAFHHLAGRLGRTIRPADYSLAALAAQAGRFTHPSPDPRSPLSTYSYGLHLDGEGLAACLRAASGVEALQGSLAEIERRTDGGIAALLLADGRRIEGDLFVDCTGAAARLIGAMQGARFESWARWLPCDRAVTAEEPDADPAPYALHAAHRAGWVRHLPLDGKRTVTLAYATSAMHDETARASLDGDVIAYESGRQAAPWIANCVAIGASAAVADPLLGLDLQLAANAAERLVRLLPHPQAKGVEAHEYNRITVAELDRARDAAILPWKVNGRQGEALWDAARATEPPEPLARKIALFESRGRVPLYDEEVLDRDEWVALLSGMGAQPRRYDPLADAIPPDRIAAHLERLRLVLGRAAGAMPRHVDYLRGAA